MYGLSTKKASKAFYGVNKLMSTLTISDFAKICYKMLLSDRDVNVVVAGMTGEGKSTFMIKLAQEYAKISNTIFKYDGNITWLRSELIDYIDSDDKSVRKPEYTAIVVDELISLFFKRNWNKGGQKGAIELFNKCRDRHLLIIGGVPVFWDLDTAFRNRVRFYVYVEQRGNAIVYLRDEVGGWSRDPWNEKANFKIFTSDRNPYIKCKNFVGLISGYGDFTPEEKKEYYKLRNTKRLDSDSQDQDGGEIEVKDKIYKKRWLITTKYLISCIDHGIKPKIEILSNAE